MVTFRRDGRLPTNVISDRKNSIHFNDDVDQVNVYPTKGALQVSGYIITLTM